ncbi:hypothetical protein [Anaeroselena agilis]|uniref:DUF4398 domain-containing protein n=1 Tax=Anaeroselena agilis TaxID=3063788 RepID=A0ABU3P2L8_9FIRM|nr:hypothetical protein [Selenomonadales bacterium 4137-cl]
MRTAIIGWLAVILLLTGIGHLARPFLDNYNDDDNAFAREYAGEMLLGLERISAEADKLAGSQAAGDYYLDAAERLDRSKQAAVHLKGDLAYDFVYAFACAEEWCRASAEARYRPRDAAAPRRARDALARARAEFTAISRKDYKRR